MWDGILSFGTIVVQNPLKRAFHYPIWGYMFHLHISDWRVEDDFEIGIGIPTL